MQSRRMKGTDALQTKVSPVDTVKVYGLRGAPLGAGQTGRTAAAGCGGRVGVGKAHGIRTENRISGV